MRIYKNEYKINNKALIDYGFIFNKGKYVFHKNILKDKFRVEVIISNNEIKTKLIEIDIDDEYLMADVENVVGQYVCKIKEEYQSVLDDIFNKCMTKEIFKFEQSLKIIKYVKNKYNDDVEYLWEKFPKNAVARNKKNNKWYLAILTVNESKIDNKSTNDIEVIDLLYIKDKVSDVVDNKKIFPGYHMNKRSWITIKLDNSVDIKEIYKFIDLSYELSLKK